MRKNVLLLILLSCLLLCSVGTAKESKYLDAVRQFADNVLKYGRDTYGPKKTPLFVDGLNIHTHEPVKWISPKGEEWILSNFASQQTLLRILDGLSSITRDPKYRDAAKEATKYAFENLRSPNGLLYWGHAAAYDAQADKIYSYNDTHTLKIHYPYYELMWDVDPDRTKRFIESFWSAHVLDWSNLDFCRISVPYSESLEKPWDHEYKKEPTFFICERSWGNGFFHTGTSLTYAGAMLQRFSGQELPLVWSKRLIQRFADTRHPNTGISAHSYNKPQRMFPNADMSERFRDPHTTVFPFHPFEGKRKSQLMYFNENWQPLPWISLLLTGHMLGEPGNDFTRWAVEELTAWGKASYRKGDNTFVPILTDGTKIEGTVLEQNCDLGLKGDTAKPLFAGPDHFWAYAAAYRISGDEFMWQMARNIGRGNGFGDIGTSAGKGVRVEATISSSDAYGLLGFLELYRKQGNPKFLGAARRIGDNIVATKFHKGFFVLSKRHVFSRFGCVEPLALLHIARAVKASQSPIPQVWPECPIFVPPYRYKETGNDRWHIYRLTESAEVPWSLQEASCIGDIEKVKSLIGSGISVNSMGDSGKSSALYRAMEGGYKEVVELLLTEGADVNLGDGWSGETPLHCASKNGQEAMVEVLVAAGADVSPQGDKGMTPLHLAIQENHIEVIKLLIAKGADTNAKNREGKTPLDVVGYRNRKEIYQLLLANGAKATSIHKAASMGMMVDTKDFLEKGVDVNAKDQDGRTPLHVAVERRNKDVVDLLIKKGADVNAKNGSGETPLDIGGYNKEIAQLLMSAGARTSSIHRAALWGLQSEVRRFLDKEVDVNAKNEDGWATLHLAAQAGRIDVMELLISKGADVNASNPKGQTSLHLALWPREQKTVKEAIDLLLSKGAGLNAKDNSGSTVLDDVAFGGSEQEIFEFLLSKGTDANNIHLAAYRGDADRVKSFLKEGVDVNEKRTTKERTPLEYAVKGGKVEVVRLLISEGADVKNNTSAFMQAVQSGNTEIAELLLANGANPNAVSGRGGMTALCAAVLRRKKEMVQLLIENGADVNAKGFRGMTALDVAKIVKNTEIMDLLKKHGAKE